MTTNSNPFETCTAAGYRADADTIAALARTNAAGAAVAERVGVTYLRVLVALTQSHIANNAPSSSERACAFNAANCDAYRAVLAGVATPDVARDATDTREESKRKALERNRRSNFARTAATTVRRFIEAGGPIESVNVADCTKAGFLRDTAALIAAAASGAPMPGASAPLDAAEWEAAGLRRAANRRWVAFKRALERLEAADRATAAKYAIGHLESIYAEAI